VVQFGEKDVVRHNLVQQIIRAYEEWDMAHPQRSGNLFGARPAAKTDYAAKEPAVAEQSVAKSVEKGSYETPQG
jgi:hypothetical protein